MHEIWVTVKLTMSSIKIPYDDFKFRISESYGNFASIKSNSTSIQVFNKISEKQHG